MARFSENSRRRQSSWQRWLPLIAGVVLIGFWISILLSGQNYSKAAILTEYFTDPATHVDASIPADVDSTDANYLKIQFLKGAEYFKSKDFQKASDTYEKIISMGNLPQYNLEKQEIANAAINQILCSLGNNDMEKFKSNINNSISADYPTTTKEIVSEIEAKVNSFWYGWAN